MIFILDTTNQDTFNKSMDTVLASLLEPSDLLGKAVKCLRCKQIFEQEEWTTQCPKCGHSTGEYIS